MGKALILFESSVNLKRSKTSNDKLPFSIGFESSVNLERSKTAGVFFVSQKMFESSVNLKRAKNKLKEGERKWKK